MSFWHSQESLILTVWSNRKMPRHMNRARRRQCGIFSGDVMPRVYVILGKSDGMRNILGLCYFWHEGGTVRACYFA